MSFDPPHGAPEREMLMSWLRYQRESMLHKVEGLTDEQARWKPAPTSNSLMSLIYHLATVEHWWFREGFLNEPELPKPVWADQGNRFWEWDLREGSSLAEAVEMYRAQWGPCDDIARAAPLDEIGKHDKVAGQGITMRWILVHMIEETARHAGHADITRELIDGSTGML